MIEQNNPKEHQMRKQMEWTNERPKLLKWSDQLANYKNQDIHIQWFKFRECWISW